MNQNVVIVGGGLAGLATATYLAHAGYDVSLFEQSSTYGGLARTQNHEGFYFNQGPHALYLTGRGIEVLKELEVPFSEKRADVTFQAIKNKKRSLFPISEKTIKESEILSESGKKALAKFYETLSSIDTTAIQNVTVSDWLTENVVEADAISVIQTMIQLATYANDPQIQSAGTALIQLQIGNNGVTYLDKGWQILVDGLAQKSRSFGAKIISNKKVVSVEFDDTVKGITLSDGGKIEASVVILATPPLVASNLLGNKIPQIEKFANSAIPVKSAVLDVALSSLPIPENHFALGIDSPLYFSVHSLFGELAPKGAALIHIAKYLSHSNQQNTKEIESELEETLELMQPNWRKYLVKKRFLPNMTVANAVLTASQNGFDGRPSPKIDRVKNLYVTGDWVGQEGWLSDASLASAKQVAGLVIDKTMIMQKSII
ncbi:MAG: NAD(P)/FAD-dependent oxidoreductase [Thaumarchaeota archaeon]|nr:NAD(P)/FAD-dependent oxidoreductase [Nitrososphaerota archaeon]